MNPGCINEGMDCRRSYMIIPGIRENDIPILDLFPGQFGDNLVCDNNAITDVGINLETKRVFGLD